MKKIIIDILQITISMSLITLPLWFFLNMKSEFMTAQINLIEAQKNLIETQKQLIETLEKKYKTSRNNNK
jgi:hypothetical protein